MHVQQTPIVQLNLTQGQTALPMLATTEQQDRQRLSVPQIGTAQLIPHRDKDVHPTQSAPKDQTNQLIVWPLRATSALLVLQPLHVLPGRTERRSGELLRQMVVALAQMERGVGPWV